MPDSEVPADVLAAEDQALASARHLASCVARHYQELRAGGVPRVERLLFTAIWLHWFAAPDPCDDDE